MQKYGKIRKLPRLPTKKIAEKFHTIPFCKIDYADFTRRTHFSHHPAGTRFCPFLSPLMAFEGVSCYHRALRSLKYSTIGSCSPSIFRFPRSFLIKRGRFLKKRGSFSKKRGRFSEKRWTFSKKRRSFFQSPPREDFIQQIGTQKSRRWKSCKIRSSTFNCENRQLSSMDTQL